jgi:phospholipase C
MNRVRQLFPITMSALLGLAACGGAGGTISGPTPHFGQKVQHVVIIFQENRTPDNLFNGLPGADTVTSGLNSSGGIVKLQPIPLEAGYDIDHTHAAWVTEYNGGSMNGFDEVMLHPNDGVTPPPNAAYGYVPSAETKPYFQLAETYTFADRMFQTNQGPSFPAHQYIISGTSAPTGSSNLLAAENPTLPQFHSAGCDAPPTVLVALIDPNGSENTFLPPCFDHETLFDLLDASGITWKYYAENFYGLWSAPDAIFHIRHNPSDWARVSVPETNVLSDIALGQLPAVSWVIPSDVNSDHSGTESATGPDWVATVTNAIGNSPYWNNTVIFVAWDDWGGWYDHVKPQIYGSYELGFRVPLIVISPYAKPGYVSHTQHEFGSILKFTEQAFGLRPIGFTDIRSDDLSDCFDFGQAPLAYHQIPTTHDAAFFKHQVRSQSAAEDY